MYPIPLGISCKICKKLKILILLIRVFASSILYQLQYNYCIMPPAKKRRIEAEVAAEAAQTASMDVDTPHINKNNIDSVRTTKLLDQHRETLKTLRSNISELATSASDNKSPSTELLLSSTLALSNLKSLQRQISLQVESHAQSSKEQREKVEECSLVLENLNYERNYLCGEITTIKGWEANELEKMAWSELGLDPKRLKEDGEDMGDDDAMEEDMEKTTPKITTAEEAINAYLLGGENSSTDTDIKSTSHRDPANHTYIVKKLQSDIKTRGSLVEQLHMSKVQLKELQKKRDSYRGFLNQIPKKLLELERAGESLNKFFGSSNVWKDVLNEEKGTDGDTKMEEKVQAANLLVNTPSFDRTKRFQLAQSNLPSPLYVMFVQLAGYLDAWATLEKMGGADNGGGSTATGEDKKLSALDGFVGAKGMDVAAVPPKEKGDSWNVMLTLSPTHILPQEVISMNRSYTKSVSSTIKIIFSYNEEVGVVYASVKDDDGSLLLDNLFPGDDGLTNPNLSLSLLKQEDDVYDDDDSADEDGDQDTENITNIVEEGSNCNGKPYYWCQELSGLNFPLPSSSAVDDSATSGKDGKGIQIQTCTKAVFRQLFRRIRARKTLEAVLEFLSKRSQLYPLPIHPSMKGDDSTINQPQSIKAKIHSWTEDSKESASTIKTYIATIKRKSSSLKATVFIDTVKYPAETPVWSLQNEDGTSGFDATLHRIECHVNEGLDKFVRQDVETTYDFILVHQLADIVACWDKVMSANEGGGSSSKGRGEDQLATFGERSPFFWYRKGL